MDTKKVLQLIFINSRGTKSTMNIPDPAEGLTGAQVKTFMDLVCAKNFFSGGMAVTPDSARVVQTNTESLDITIA